jgi:hypothetical protein
VSTVIHPRGSEQNCSPGCSARPPSAARNRERLPILGRLFLAAFLLFATAGLIRPADAQSLGTGRVSSVVGFPTLSACVHDFLPGGVGGTGVEEYDVQPGRTYDVTLTSVTNCANSGTDPTIQVIVLSSATGNQCLTAMKVSTGTYTFRVTIPTLAAGACGTMPILYCTSNCSPTTGFFARRRDGRSFQAHLRAASFGSGCSTPIPITTDNGCGTHFQGLTCPSGDTTVCQGTVVELDFDTSQLTGGHSPYTVTVGLSNGTAMISPIMAQTTIRGTGSPSIHYTVSNLPVGTTTVTFTVTDSGDPALSTQCSFVITVIPNPSCLINGPSSVCAGSTGNTYMVTTDAASPTTYLWSITGNGTIPGSTTGSSVTVDAATTAGSYTLSVTVTDGVTHCSSTCTFPVTVNPNPTVQVTGGTTICSGFSATLTATVTGGTAPFTYTWSDGTVHGPTVLTTDSITVSPTSTTSYSVIVTDANNCTGTSNSVTVTVNECQTGCTLTIGGYRNHFRDLVSSLTDGNGLTLGGQSYSVSELLQILDATGAAGDSLLIMTQQLITAELNETKITQAGGTVPSDVPTCVAEGDAILATFSSKVAPVGTATAGPSYTVGGVSVSDVINCLNNFNTGNDGVPHCE